MVYLYYGVAEWNLDTLVANCLKGRHHPPRGAHLVVKLNKQGNN